MICYLCGKPVPEDQSFYNDHGQQVCVPCFKDAQRCFICRFPGKQLELVPGLGLECEFCRGNVIAEGDDLGALIEPLAPFLKGYGLSAPENPRYEWADHEALRIMQTDADLPKAAFIDDFLRYCYPVFYNDGAFHCLRRMTKATFVSYAIIQFGVADIASRFRLPHLSESTPFHTFARGFCHWVGFEAAQRLNYDLEWRQLRKWPELGARGEFERWQSMAGFSEPAEIVSYCKSNLTALSKKHLNSPGDN